jgi:sec-independent protein translocase protein TatA
MTLTNLPLLFGLGGQELVIILVVVLLLFGAKKIPELARGLGKGIREFKDASQEIKREIENAGENEEESKRLKNQ